MQDAAEEFIGRIESLASELDDVRATGKTFEQTTRRFRNDCYRQVTRLYRLREPRG